MPDPVTQFEVKLGFPKFSAPLRSMEQWAEVMGLNAPRFYQKLKATIKSEEDFANKLADPATTGFQEVVTFSPTRKGKNQAMIYAARRKKLVAAYQKWQQKLDYAFATVDDVVAKRYKEAVTAAKNLWGKGAERGPLRATGTKLEGLGASVIAGYWLTNHRHAAGAIRAGTDVVVSGNPFNICRPGLQNTLVSAVVQNLTYALTTAQQAGLDPTILLTLNTRLNQVAQMHVDPALGIITFTPGGLSHLDVINDPTLGEMVSVKVSRMS